MMNWKHEIIGFLLMLFFNSILGPGVVAVCQKFGFPDNWPWITEVVVLILFDMYIWWLFDTRYYLGVSFVLWFISISGLGWVGYDTVMMTIGWFKTGITPPIGQTALLLLEILLVTGVFCLGIHYFSLDYREQNEDDKGGETIIVDVV